MLSLLFLSTLLSAKQPDFESSTYLRPEGDGFKAECVLFRSKRETGVRIFGRTDRGKTTLGIVSEYDEKGLLIEARVNLRDDKKDVSASVIVKSGKATVKRDGKEAQEFDVPPGVIVTSAPDWTDAWMLCRRFDRAKKGKQEFAGLWIHPVDPAQRLTFAIEHKGADAFEHAGKKQEIDRVTIWLRGNSSYAVWADSQGQMIKLVPLPYKKEAANWIVLQGYEKSTANLKP